MQFVDVPETVADELAVLSDGCNSCVSLETLDELVIVEPSVASAFTLNAIVNTATAFAGKVAIVQLMVPLPLPTVGVVQVKVGPEVCASDTKVVPPGTELVSTTF